MRTRHIRIIQALFLTVLTTISLYSSDGIDLNCYSIVVGKNASFDGSVIVAHNEDDYGDQLVNLYRVPAESHAFSAMVTFKNGGQIPQKPNTLGFLWIQLPGMDVSDACFNEKGVSVFSDGCPSREKNPELTDGGIVYWIRRSIAESAQSAKEGVKIAGRLIDQFGYASSGRTYVIADKNEAWMLAAVNGKHWIAQRVPDDEVAVIPNYYTIGAINLADTANFMGSDDIIEYAVEKGWYGPNENGEFNFARAYTALTSINHPGNIHRMLRGLNLLSDKQYTLNDAFPFSFKPKHKIDFDDIKSVLRDHYVGCEFDKSDHYKLGNPHKLNEATICSGSTQFSVIVHLRDKLPVNIGTVIWIAPFRPGVQAYTPWYLGIESIPKGYAYTNYNTAIAEQFNPPKFIFEKNGTHNYWKFVNKVEHVDQDFKSNYIKTQAEISELEKHINDEMSEFENKILHIYKDNPERARKMLTDFSAKWAAEALKLTEVK